MDASGEEIARRSEVWTCWPDVEDAACRLGQHSGVGAADVDAAVSRVLDRFLRTAVSGVIRHPKAWGRVVMAHELGRLRGQPVILELLPSDGSVVAGDGVEASAADLAELRRRLQPHESEIRGLLSEAEIAVYDGVRSGMTLAGCAKACGMTVRDVRVRFRRICRKLRGFFPRFRPPPPLAGGRQECLPVT